MQDIKTYLSSTKKEINSYLKKKFTIYKDTYFSIGSTSLEALKRLEEFSLGGKGIRGGLFYFSATAFGSKQPDVIGNIAAGLEILQSSLLIHDDIMDNDFTRRGNPSLFAQYETIGAKAKLHNTLDYGKAMGICVGDIGFFIALDICSNALINHPYKKGMMSLLYQELLIVGLAQMDDVTFAASNRIPTTEEIMRMYLYKTAHYTFSLPLSLGAILTGKSQQTIKNIEKLGEYIGLLFQIRDDEIGVFFDTNETGKPLGSDLRENKKTIIRALLENKMNTKEKKIISSLHGKKSLLAKDIQTYKNLLAKYNIQTEIMEMCKKYTQMSDELITKIEISEEDKNLLRQLVSYVSKRTS